MGESENIELIVEPSLSGMRLDAYLREQTPFSRSRIASLMEEGALLVNGEVERKAARKTEGGMRLLLVVPEAQPVDIVPQNIPLDILYQDADIVVVNKKSGMVVHPAAGNESGTLVNALLYHVHDLSGIGGEMRPGIVHRLDKDTSGSWCSMLLVLLSVLLTGFNIYPQIAKFGGAGALVPITGFANSVAAPAIEFKKEGQVFGIGCKIFTIAGPVILYGILASWVLGMVKYFWRYL